MTAHHTLPAVASAVCGLEPAQPLQPSTVGGPVGIAGSWHSPIVVEVYALGVGIALVREGADLIRTQGAFELEAAGRRFVFDSGAVWLSERLVVPIQGDVAAIAQPLQAIDEQQAAQIDGVGGSHGSPLCFVKTAILSLPQGWGKSQLAGPLMRLCGCTQIVEEWHPSFPVTRGALHLTNADIGEVLT